MTDKLKTGDKVEWQTSQGKTTGTVKKVLTSPTEIKGHHVAASWQDTLPEQHGMPAVPIEAFVVADRQTPTFAK